VRPAVAILEPLQALSQVPVAVAVVGLPGGPVASADLRDVSLVRSDYRSTASRSSAIRHHPQRHRHPSVTWTAGGCGLTQAVSRMCPERHGCVRNDSSPISPDRTLTCAFKAPQLLPGRHRHGSSPFRAFVRMEMLTPGLLASDASHAGGGDGPAVAGQVAHSLGIRRPESRLRGRRPHRIPTESRPPGDMVRALPRLCVGGDD
jgi:hypothetical protein